MIPRRPVLAGHAATAWDVAFGLIACLLVGLFPFLPDEKLNRLKLLFLQVGLSALVAAVGARAIVHGGLLHDAPSHGPPSRWKLIHSAPAAVGAWLAVNVVFALIAKEKALAWSELGRVGLAAVAFAAFRYARLDERWTARVLFAWTAAALLTSVYATLQQRGGIGPVVVPKMDRVIGTFGNPIFLSSYLVLSLFVATAAWRMTLRDSERAFAFVTVVLIVPAIAASQTRATYLGLAAAIVAAVVFATPVRKVRMLVLALVAIAAAAVISYPLWKRDQAHILIWRDTLRLVAQHPFLGVGLGAFHVHFPSVAQADLISKWPKGQFVVNHAHNEFLQSLAEGGPLLALSLLAVFITFFAGVWRRAAPPDRYGSAAPLALGVLAVAVQNLFSVDMRFSVSLVSTFAVMGLASSEGRAWPKVDGEHGIRPVRVILGLVWVGLVGLFVYRAVFKPHVEQRRVAKAPSFFDQRLLEPAKTISDLEALAAKFPDEPDVLEKLGYACAKEMKSGDGSINGVMMDKAVAAYKRVAELDPKRLSAHNNLANIYYTVGRADEAVAAWRRALEIDGGFLDARLNLGKVLYARGDLKESAAEFQEVLKLQPGHPEASLYLRRMVE